MKNLYNLPCSIAQSLNIIGDKWTLLIVKQLLMGNNTYNLLMNSLKGIPTNLLSSRLKSMEEAGLISSSLYQKHPPRYSYELTAMGKALEDVLNAITIWGNKYIDDCYKELKHKECSAPLELHYHCPSCEREVSREEIIVSE